MTHSWRLFLLITIAMVTGCATQARTPPEIQTVPNVGSESGDVLHMFVFTNPGGSDAYPYRTGYSVRFALDDDGSATQAASEPIDRTVRGGAAVAAGPDGENLRQQ